MVDGYEIGDDFSLALVAGAGNLVVAIELESPGGSDELIGDLVARAIALQVAQPWTTVD